MIRNMGTVVFLFIVQACTPDNIPSPHRITESQKTGPVVKVSQKPSSQQLAGQNEKDDPVKTVKVSEVKISDGSVTVEAGKKISLNALVLLDNNDTNSAIEWFSSDNTVASVDNNGHVSALKKGKALIRAVSLQDNTKWAGCLVFVNDEEKFDPVAVEIKNITGKTSIGINENLQLTGMVKYSKGNFNNAISWQSSNEKIAAVNENGLVIGRSSGTVLIYAISKNNNLLTASQLLTVTEERVTEPVSVKNVFYSGKDFIPGVNPNGAWSYGGGKDEGFIISLNFTKHSRVITGGSEELDLITGNTCNFHFNNTDKTIETLGQIFEPETLYLHPGSYYHNNPVYCVVRWTAPEKGVYNVKAKFTSAENISDKTKKATTGAGVRKNNRLLWRKFINEEGQPDYQLFSEKYYLDKNEILDFTVDRGLSNSSTGDLTKVNIEITKE